MLPISNTNTNVGTWGVKVLDSVSRVEAGQPFDRLLGGAAKPYQRVDPKSATLRHRDQFAYLIARAAI